MLYIPEISDYLKFLTNDRVKDFLVINFREYFKSKIEKLCSKLSKQQNQKKIVKFLYILLAAPDEVENTLR